MTVKEFPFHLTAKKSILWLSGSEHEQWTRAKAEVRLLALWVCIEPLFLFINFQQCVCRQAMCRAEGSNRDVLFIFQAGLIS